ncbi:DUF72 domain-containing protein [Deinococcus deserti]|uniref:DUF72 domain-containing protein n=2 Tax=Deinococcus TaxID=1298 RepID=C1CZH6_DEIDV|nr:hypothetical protein Deide_21941 [Deinococcus deserti VCD115]
MTQVHVNLGCASWSVASGQTAQFGQGGSVLQRYATRFRAVEINSSFYRPHRQSTYQRWAASVPEDFRFSAKVPKAVTHQARLQDCHDLLSDFVHQTAGLGESLGCLLVQLPPSLTFDEPVAEAFFRDLRLMTPVPVACEPRHGSWFSPAADALLITHRIGRVAADPALTTEASVPGGHSDTVYYRWHGSPRMYFSSYSDQALQTLAQDLQDRLAIRPWVIFDNTAAGAAAENGLKLMELLARDSLTHRGL